MTFTRSLKYKFPIMSGEDVFVLQKRLQQLGLTVTGQPDGIFGLQTDVGVRAFQHSRGLVVDGVAGPKTWEKLFEERQGELELEKIIKVIEELKQPHRFRNSIVWQLAPNGIIIKNDPTEPTEKENETVRRVWNRFNGSIEEWSVKFGVPAELIIATICTESGGDSSTLRKEPGYVSDQQTPHKISPGIMQTLISTARATLCIDNIDRAWLMEPANSIRAGTAYIAAQWTSTLFDPPKVACAYNAGGIYFNDSAQNRWKMRQYPINSSAHADRFVRWFNACVALLAETRVTPYVSYCRLLRV